MRTFRFLLPLPFLVLLVLYGYSFNHQHKAGAVYDEKDPRHVFSSCELLKIKKCDSASCIVSAEAPVPAVLTPLLAVPERNDLAIVWHCEGWVPRVSLPCFAALSCPNRASPAFPA
ncbi:hypothetical protein GMST_20170 [Geomonas silvestris]|uniref:Uncharacterized protein n=1 Tax=Geomonas silvestris TaxID=2740184 RepID=A0A6V8MI90_9BACT|nr:hypothetical protein GMST_20170 [Geomonas silvestris]